MDATLFTLRTGSGLVIKPPELPALPSAEGPGVFICISEYNLLQCNLILRKVEYFPGIRGSFLSGKEEFPDKKKAFCLQVWGKLELGGKVPVYVLRNEYWAVL